MTTTGPMCIVSELSQLPALREKNFLIVRNMKILEILWLSHFWELRKGRKILRTFSPLFSNPSCLFFLCLVKYYQYHYSIIAGQRQGLKLFTSPKNNLRTKNETDGEKKMQSFSLRFSFSLKYCHSGFLRTKTRCEAFLFSSFFLSSLAYNRQAAFPQWS